MLKLLALNAGKIFQNNKLPGEHIPRARAAFGAQQDDIHNATAATLFRLIPARN
jgi:hypothetical protein